jgi:hypothetical protein
METEMFRKLQTLCTAGALVIGAGLPMAMAQTSTTSPSTTPSQSTTVPSPSTTVPSPSSRAIRCGLERIAVDAWHAPDPAQQPHDLA